MRTTAHRSTTSPGGRLAASYTTLIAAHDIVDYWAQTRHQAVNKGRHGNVHEDAAGRRACLAHVASYTAASTAAIGAANAVLGLGANWRGILTGQAISFVTHYIADRRYPLRDIAAKTGRLEYYETPIGSAQLDQSWHRGWLAVAALATATLGTRTDRGG